jgi:hypothetical protein
MELKDSSRRDFLVAGLAVAAIAAGCNTKTPFEAAAADDVKPSGKKSETIIG